MIKLGNNCKEVKYAGDCICWDCKNTNQHECSWFKKNAVMPDGCKYQYRKSNGNYPDAYRILRCPNFKSEKTEQKNELCVAEDKIEIFPGVVKPKKIRMINDKATAKISTFNIVNPLKWALNFKCIPQTQMCREIGIAEVIIGRILRHDITNVTVGTYNAIAKYINKLIKEDNEYCASQRRN